MKRFIIRNAEKYGWSNYFLKLYFLYHNYLKSTGWLKSIIRLSSIDKNGHPIPWFTYPAIHFLKNRVNTQMDVFEYGSGNSTIWFANRVKQIWSLESDKMWFEKVNSTAKSLKNVHYIFEEDVQGGKYAKAILQTNQLFDIIIIDGKDRNNCCFNAVQNLKPEGIVIWDNTDCLHWQEGIKFLIENGFKRIDFWGIPPLAHFDSCTSIFYRSNNCFDI